MATSLLVVFVHGWSVTNTDTYGELPARLKREAGKDGGPPLDIRNIYLGQYVSFRDRSPARGYLTRVRCRSR
jgi:hypothetical protein